MVFLYGKFCIWNKFWYEGIIVPFFPHCYVVFCKGSYVSMGENKKMSTRFMFFSVENCVDKEKFIFI